MRELKNISKFYLIFTFLLLLLAIMVILVVRTMFSSWSVSNQIDEEVLQNSIPHLNNGILDEAYNKTMGRSIPNLDL